MQRANSGTKAAALAKVFFFFLSLSLKDEKIQSLSINYPTFSNFSVFAFKLKPPGQTVDIFNQFCCNKCESFCCNSASR